MRRALVLTAALACMVTAAYAVTVTRGQSVFEWIKVSNLQPDAYTTISATVDLTRAQWRSAGYFPVSTTGGAVEVQVSSTLEAADYGVHKHFVVTAGGTNVLTIAADAAGVTTVTLHAQCPGASSSCEDVGDSFDCFGIAAQTMICNTCCTD